ncbi:MULTISPECIES: SDR family NAD(P)-dependent oxidoreductase [unclassified Modicisalibacter]|uniref:SDR family NAD(P)-dependent oxidoreductase n=1 Tax=unclassified Modicisalibacter TaxID=2679913 RepID=UPI001CCE6382|nr:MULTISPECIES: SDR family NAD(P)-dependent oxidoreductase [unclassified Modicisalibacter]MBZ9557989.1 SDR family oxidoreductase [Modicisalibacter sp. R2A 31.J]MBZ9573343.1 SDR family oxidoreductase [Modicisalibacter sp. MOD 31.J]
MRVLEQFSVEGRSALVTGGASGLGLAYVEALVENGARVTLADIDVDAAIREAARLREQGFEVHVQALDVADREQTRLVFEEHVRRFDGLDIVFANAGIDPGAGFWNPGGWRNEDGQVDTLDPARWDRTIAINLTGTFNTLRMAAKYMKPRRRGSIVVTSSNAAVITEPVVGLPYMPAKAGVSHMVRQLALELAAFGIRVNTIAPGGFVTNIGGGWLKDSDVRQSWDAKVPLGQLAEPEQIKALALYLASEASSYMTGAQLVIDGGTSLGRVG